MPGLQHAADAAALEPRRVELVKIRAPSSTAAQRVDRRADPLRRREHLVARYPLADGQPRCSEMVTVGCSSRTTMPFKAI